MGRKRMPQPHLLVSKNTSPWHYSPLKKKFTQPNQCWRAFLLRAAERDRSILESLFSAIVEGQEEDPGHFKEPGGCEFLSQCRSAVGSCFTALPFSRGFSFLVSQQPELAVSLLKDCPRGIAERSESPRPREGHPLT